MPVASFFVRIGGNRLPSTGELLKFDGRGNEVHLSKRVFDFRSKRGTVQ